MSGVDFISPNEQLGFNQAPGSQGSAVDRQLAESMPFKTG